KRTPTVEQMVAEFRHGVDPSIHTSQMPSMTSLPVSSLNVLTRPPRSNVYVDNVSVGNTSDSGILLLEGIQSGNHHLRVSHNGFQDWTSDVVCDGKPVEVVAELRAQQPTDPNAIPKPTFQTLSPANTQAQMSQHQVTPLSMQETIASPSQTFQQPKKKGIAGLVLGIGAVLGLFVLGVIGIVAAYMLGVFGGGAVPPNNATASPTPKTANSPATTVKAEMIQLPGGTFKMGRSDVSKPEELNQKPEHTVKVEPFSIDKTEVTNGEYAQFVAATGHAAPKHWSNNQPVSGTENRPVSYVSMDDANAFAAWRSKRDGVTYRLPTEQEWEFAARNGDKGDTYPWGSGWDATKAVMAVGNSEPTDVGSKPAGKSDAGILDLIGNVWEWTSTELAAYPGSNVDIIKKPGKRIMIRGGSANEDP
ncbi:MAG TPA: SUMF1/EgtB/PvdO family nonheme iron enzyme, partial [Pyrinomonadaceae bacterium]|nr:SUMF1/EgtB/PvdO family nonheme iron enzyme [Pyrinomonadaceae bacterium]